MPELHPAVIEALIGLLVLFILAFVLEMGIKHG